MVLVKTFTISCGTRPKIEGHLLTGQLPKRAFIGLVTNKPFNGTLHTYPFFSQHFILVKWMSLVMDMVSMENHFNLDLEMISISDLSYLFTKH